MNVGDEETGMTAEVGPDHTAPRDKLPLTSTGVSPGVHHHLGALVRSEIRVVEVPVGVGRPTKDVEAFAVGIVTGDANTGEPGLGHA